MIQSDHLTLRAIVPADFAALYEIQRDPLAMRYTYIAPSFAEFSEHIMAYMALEATIGYAPWTIIETATALICGWGGLGVDPFDPGWGVEIFYFFAPQVWGRGYATELTNTALLYGFTQLGLPAIGAFAHPENRASNRVLAKCGLPLLRYEPKLARNFYEITRVAWSNHHKAPTPAPHGDNSCVTH